MSEREEMEAAYRQPQDRARSGPYHILTTPTSGVVILMQKSNVG